MTEADKPEGIPAPPTAPQAAEPPPAETEERGPPARLRNLDLDIESELEAAMGGMTDKDLYGDPAAQARPAPAEAGQGGRKKGRIMAIHGPDVFVDLPGGRSQGVLPMTHFPAGPP